MTNMRFKVAILQHRLLHYRVDLFERLRADLIARGIQLEVVYGQASHEESKRGDEGRLDWGHQVKNHIFSLGGKDLIWQPLPPELADSDLLVLMQENRILSNYPHLFKWSSYKGKLAYWGHGRNFQSINPTGLRERWKRGLVTSVDWWFTYTETSATYLYECGFPAHKLTCLNNAVDTRKFASQITTANNTAAELRQELGISKEDYVGIYCGSLYPGKRLDFLTDVAKSIQARLGRFHLLIVGNGPEYERLQAQALDNPNIHLLGVRKGVKKARLYGISDVVLNPGAVGLHILDAFAAGLPMITTKGAMHGPEIAYLEDGKNGLVCNDLLESYVDAVIDLLEDRAMYNKISNNARQDAERYTLDKMVAHFSEGIEQCLA